MRMQDVPVLPDFAAGGSLPLMPAIARPSNGRCARLIGEVILLFVAVPLAIAAAIQAAPVSLFLLLAPPVLGVIAYLASDRSFSLRREVVRGFQDGELISMTVLFLVAAVAMAVWIWLYRPTDFLSFPRHRPEFWLLVMMIYPLLSALPQEVVYRTFFFHRYGPLFEGRRWLAIGANGALFGFAHVIIGNGTAIVLSGVLGLLLAYRYTHARSLRGVWIEHTLYGWLVFTVGLGQYFYIGASVS